ncbi:MULTISPECIES: rhodanese-like domain-containing protein [unclassified Nitratiruptor]|uniref:rhodanese-like domain-containing protein n=1 Tax=unclassified Nitratiruptor TaxID=2624044 RepID=UPI001916C10F|nr:MULTISPECIES: rhodanese-like domain-containing protein [unclassified Nitratiruptor]BCD60096.1 hypothetical protein NitYY0810_C0861 [Nitratiruptor sp. YY08-10]BCD64415.1 hypothetical protein NitYY0814_C1260 [Nitratiruptor sp. YY08-14]
MRILFASLFLISALFAYTDLDAKSFYKLTQQKGVILLDVRTPQEYQEGHIPGANLIPLQLFRYIFLGGKGIADKKILVYCRSGNRSAEASRMLESWGIKHVYNLKYGILDWKKHSLPLQK